MEHSGENTTISLFSNEGRMHDWSATDDVTVGMQNFPFANAWVRNINLPNTDLTFEFYYPFGEGEFDLISNDEMPEEMAIKQYTPWWAMLSDHDHTRMMHTFWKSLLNKSTTDMMVFMRPVGSNCEFKTPFTRGYARPENICKLLDRFEVPSSATLFLKPGIGLHSQEIRERAQEEFAKYCSTSGKRHDHKRRLRLEHMWYGDDQRETFLKLAIMCSPVGFKSFSTLHSTIQTCIRDIFSSKAARLFNLMVCLRKKVFALPQEVRWLIAMNFFEFGGLSQLERFQDFCSEARTIAWTKHKVKTSTEALEKMRSKQEKADNDLKKTTTEEEFAKKVASGTDQEARDLLAKAQAENERRAAQKKSAASIERALRALEKAKETEKYLKSTQADEDFKRKAEERVSTINLSDIQDGYRSTYENLRIKKRKLEETTAKAVSHYNTAGAVLQAAKEEEKRTLDKKTGNAALFF